MRVDLHYSLNGNANIQNRVFYTFSGTLSPTDATTWAAYMMSSFITSGHVGAALSAALELSKVVVTDLTSNTGAQGVASTGVVCLGGTPSVTPGQALVVERRIARRYRGGHSRVYIPGMPYSQLTSAGTWVSTAPGAIAGDWEQWESDNCTHAPSAVGTVLPISVSYFAGFTNVTYPSGRTRPVPKLRTGGPVKDQVTAWVGDPSVKSQRRRQL